MFTKDAGKKVQKVYLCRPNMGPYHILKTVNAVRSVK